MDQTLMKLMGFVLLPAGWIILLAALALLASSSQAAFVLAGLGVQILGLTLVVRSHLIPHHEDKR